MCNNKKTVFIVFCMCCVSLLQAQIPLPIKQLMAAPYMRGASLALAVREIDSNKMLYEYQPDLEITPASVMKTITTSAALELLGEDFRFATVLEYDGDLVDGVLNGNLYIRGSGDPSLGSRYLKTEQTAFLTYWLAALQTAGIKKITGSVIADEGCFDNEGISMKWVSEDLGSYYGAGSYGISVFDNNYSLTFKTGTAGSQPELLRTDPEMNQLTFHNYLVAAKVATDSAYIVGAPFARDRYLYGVLPVSRESCTLKGDIPDPALFLSTYLTDYLRVKEIVVEGEASCRRILQQNGNWTSDVRKELITTYSPTLKEIVRIVNEISQNLYADALIKTIGLLYTSPSRQVLSSFGKGVAQINTYWQTKGLDVSSLWIYDGSGLAVTSKLSARFVIDLLTYMQKTSPHKDAFFQSLPVAGVDGSVRNFLKGTSLEGKAHIKSGSMSRVKGYAGYINKEGKRYVFALFVNNYACEGKVINQDIERLLVALF